MSSLIYGNIHPPSTSKIGKGKGNTESAEFWNCLWCEFDAASSNGNWASELSRELLCKLKARHKEKSALISTSSLPPLVPMSITIWCQPSLLQNAHPSLIGLLFFDLSEDAHLLPGQPVLRVTSHPAPLSVTTSEHGLCSRPATNHTPSETTTTGRWSFATFHKVTLQWRNGQSLCNLNCAGQEYHAKSLCAYLPQHLICYVACYNGSAPDKTSFIHWDQY